MKKLLILLIFLFSTILFAWVGSNAVVRLVHPESVYYKPEASWALKDTPKLKQYCYTSSDVLVIVYNPTQGIDKFNLTLKDMTNNETKLIYEEEDHNSSNTYRIPLKLLANDIKKGKQYELKLQGWDLNGSTCIDTAIIEQKVEGFYLLTK